LRSHHEQGDRDDERFGSTENEASEVAMALRGAIDGFACRRSPVSVWIAVIVDLTEVEADDPRSEAEDHRRLLEKEAIDDGFEFVS